jgi:hypothetical protein
MHVTRLKTLTKLSKATLHKYCQVLSHNNNLGYFADNNDTGTVKFVITMLSSFRRYWHTPMHTLYIKEILILTLCLQQIVSPFFSSCITCLAQHFQLCHLYTCHVKVVYQLHANSSRFTFTCHFQYRTFPVLPPLHIISHINLVSPNALHVIPFG